MPKLIILPSHYQAISTLALIDVPQLGQTSTDGNRDLDKILGYPEREVAATTGGYALCAVDNMGQESEGIVVEVGVSTNRLK